MKVTDVKVYVITKSKSNLLAFANITLDDELVIKGLKIIEGKKGNFVSFPSSKGSDGNYYDDVFPLTKELKEEIIDAVLYAYDFYTDEDEEEEKPVKKRSRK